MNIFIACIKPHESDWIFFYFYFSISVVVVSEGICLEYSMYYVEHKDKHIFTHLKDKGEMSII